MFCRLYHASTVNRSIKKQGSKLCKMINPSSKKQWYPSLLQEGLPTVKGLTKTKHEPGKRSTRRISMLNKIFMKQITDIMSTGTPSLDIVGRGIEISKVKVTPDFQTVNVFWVCKGNSSDEETEHALNRMAGLLRHELSTLRVMGVVPYIAFVKDKQEAVLVDLDRRLAAADYGEDYAPTELGHLLKTDFTLNTKLSPEMKAKIRQLEDETAIEEDPIPDMTNHVFGLDHAKIMSRLLAARKRSKDAWSSMSEESPIVSYRAPENTSTPEYDVTKQKQELAEFLQKRQILQNKLHKQLLNTREDFKLVLDEEEDDYENEVYDDDYSEDEDEYLDSDESLQHDNEKNHKSLS